MKHLSPMGARRSLAYSEKYDTHLAVGHRRALETIAGMHEEWGIAVTYMGLREVEEWGFDTRDGAEAEGTTLGTEYRIIRRYVTETEEIS